jgi:hypothetical protein
MDATMMHQDFVFVDHDRTFRCHVAPVHARSTDAWWWFDVSTEDHQRHAPFRAEDGDTPASVQARVVAYYNNLLERRAAPVQNRWNRRPVPPTAPIEIVVTADAVPAADATPA